MQIHDLVLGLAAMIAEALGTISGFGSSTFFVPIATMFESFQLVLILTALLHILSNLAKLHLFRSSMPIRKWLGFALTSFIFTAVGAQLTTYADEMILRRALGIFLMLAAGSHFISRKRPFAPWLGWPLIALSGFCTGMVGTGGALRGLVLTSLGLEKYTFIFVSSLIDLGGDLIRAAIYLNQGYMDWSQWYYLPILFCSAAVGAYVGKRAVDKIPQTTFANLVLLLTALSGLLLAVRGN